MDKRARQVHLRSAPANAGTKHLVNQFFNDSTGKGQDGAVDITTKWAKKHGFEVVENPAIHPDRIAADGPLPKGKNKQAAE